MSKIISKGTAQIPNRLSNREIAEVTNICKECGVDFFTTDPDRMLCHPCIHLSRVDLKLFTCRVIWATSNRMNSWFTLLHVDAESAQDAVLEKLEDLKHNTGFNPGEVSVMEVSEIIGPFEPGTFIHVET